MGGWDGEVRCCEGAEGGVVGCCEGAEGGVVGVAVRGWEVVEGVVGA